MTVGVDWSMTEPCRACAEFKPFKDEKGANTSKGNCAQLGSLVEGWWTGCRMGRRAAASRVSSDIFIDDRRR